MQHPQKPHSTGLCQALLPSTPWGRGLQWAAFATLVLAANTVAAQTTTTGESRSVVQLDVGESDEISLARERHVGDSIAKTLVQDTDYLDDPIISDAVEDLWRALMQSARRQNLLSPAMEQAYAWRIFLSKDKSLNAFALPGGYFGLHLGLVAATQSPDELASVMAHELSHVTQRHLSRAQAQYNRMTPALMAAMLLGVLAAKKSDTIAQVATAGSSALGLQQQLNYSREMEREADRLGYSILAGAGLETQGFVTVFEKLQFASRFSDDASSPYLRTHPLTNERIAAAQSRNQQEAAGRTSPPAYSSPVSPLAYTLIGARARALSAVSLDALRPWAVQVDQANFSQQTLEKRATALVIGSHFFEQSGQSAKAATMMRQLQALVSSDANAAAFARRFGADLALSQRQWAVAAQYVSTPSQGRSDTLLKARALMGLGQYPAAAEALQLWVAQHPMDALAWQLLAQVYEQTARPLGHIRALAEAQLAQYDREGALDRLQSALSVAKAVGVSADSELDLSIIHSRIRAISGQIERATP